MERTDWIGVRRGQTCKFFVPHHCRMRWLAHGHRILRKCTSTDVAAPPSPARIMPLVQAQREAAQRVVPLIEAPTEAPPRKRRSKS